MIRRALFIFYLTVISKLDSIRCMESFIVGGKPADIGHYSYSAYMTLESNDNMFACGSSILNQNILLTAAHCFEDLGSDCSIGVRAGSANKLRGELRMAVRFAIHKYYNTDTVENDIALVYIEKPFGLGSTIKRVVLMNHPPQKKFAYVSGWGLRDEYRNTQTDWLQQTEQRVWTSAECRKVLKTIPHSTICGSNESGKSYASSGDSGSALVVDDYIQIGLVSYKLPDISLSLVVYTDVAQYFDWIATTSKKIRCYASLLYP